MVHKAAPLPRFRNRFRRKGQGALARRLTSLAAFGVCLAGLAGCTHSGTDQAPRTATTVPLSEAMVFPPPGGPALISVIETRYANAVSQNISLATNARTPGENRIAITRFLAAGGSGDFGELADVSLLEVDLAAEAQSAWPQAGMQVSPFYVQNAYGPFGYAVGRSQAGDTCLYAWQRVEPSLRPSGSIGRGTVAIRLQVCDRARSEQDLLHLMYDMRLRDPVFEPRPASPVIGRAGAPITPQGQAGFANVAPPRPAPRPAPQPAPTPQVQVQPVAVPAAQEAPAPIVPSGPIVPLPGGARPGTDATPPSAVRVPLPPGTGAP